MMRSMGGLGGSGDKASLDDLDMGESDSDDDDPPELEWTCKKYNKIKHQNYLKGF